MFFYVRMYIYIYLMQISDDANYLTLNLNLVVWLLAYFGTHPTLAKSLDVDRQIWIPYSRTSLGLFPYFTH